MATPGDSSIDWATDFDLGDPRYESNPYEIWDELRDSCPIAHTERRGGIPWRGILYSSSPREL